MSETFVVRHEQLNSSLDQIINEFAQCCRYHANALGEVLREWAFVGKGYGCYSNFNIRPEFQNIKITIREAKLLLNCNDDDFDNEVIERGQWFKHPNGIEIGWYWDGDGILAFFIPELIDNYYNGVLINGDCKYDNEWHFQTYSEIEEEDCSY